MTVNSPGLPPSESEGSLCLNGDTLSISSNTFPSIPPRAKSNRLGVAKKWVPCSLDDEEPEAIGCGNTSPFDAILPGHGDSGSNCGSSTICHCQKCGNYWETTSQCNQRECPDCWTAWVMKEAERASSRLWVLANKIYYGKRQRRIVHAVVSFPYVKGQSYQRQRSKAMGIAMKHGISGGFIICHPFRAQDHEYIPDGYVHYHIVGLAKGSIKVFEEGEKAPYIFKFIKDHKYHDYRGVRTYEEVKRLTSYQLSHCGIVKGSHALAWFGTMSYNYSICGVRFNTKARFSEDYPELARHLQEIYQIQCPKCHSTEVSITPAWRIESMLSYDFHPEVTLYLKGHPR